MNLTLFKMRIAALLCVMSAMSVVADNGSSETGPFIITGTVIDRISHKPVNAEVVFCEQTGEEIINFNYEEKCFTNKNGEFQLVLSKCPDKNIGNYALNLRSMRDDIDKETGDTVKVSWLIYVSRYAAVEIPDTGKVCNMPVIEMDRVVYQDDTWPYELPQKLIDMEREDSIKYSKYSIFE